MRTIEANRLLEYPTSVLEKSLIGEFTLEFEDGPLVVNHRATIFSSYSWDFHRDYPKTKLLRKHHLQGPICKQFDKSSHLALIEASLWDAYDAYGGEGGISRETLARKAYMVLDEIYNRTHTLTRAHYTTIDFLDFVELSEYQPIIDAKNLSDDLSDHALEQAYKKITTILMTDPKLAHNNIVRGCRIGTLRMGQVLQCIAFRGNVTDDDSSYFRFPVMRSFSEGLRLQYDHIVETRSAGKALRFAGDPLRKAEYFSRKLQLVGEQLMNLHFTDCGSTKYLTAKLRGRENRIGCAPYRGNFREFLGANYLDETTGKLKVLRAEDTHLIGKTMKFRNPLHCNTEDPYGCCSTCFGELSLAILRDTNLGQITTTFVARQMTQSVMSVKHEDGSSAVEGAILDEYEQKFLSIPDKDKCSFKFNESIKSLNPVIVVPQVFAKNFTDIMTIPDVNNLHITHVTEFPKVWLNYDVVIKGMTAKGRATASLDVSVGKRQSSFTMAMLRHIRQHGWKIREEDGNYEISLEHWNYAEPAMAVPMKHFNMSDQSKAVEQMIESSMTQLEARGTKISPDSFLLDFMDTVNHKLSVNIAVLSAIVKGIMIRDAETYDYWMPKNDEPRGLGVLPATMKYRSLGPAFGYQEHYSFLVDPISFTHTNRPDHPMDAIVCPREVMEYQKK